MAHSKGRPIPVIDPQEDDIGARLWIMCCRTGKRMRWNDAARAGWVTGETPYTYESPEEHETEF